MTATLAAPTSTDDSVVDRYFADFAAERASTRRMLSRVPDEQLDWRPHPKSRTLGELAVHVAELPNRGAAILTLDEVDNSQRPAPGAPPRSGAELLARHDAALARLEAALASTDEASLAAPWTLRRGPQVLISGPRRTMLRVVMMSHLVHHRAQLGVYLRLLGVPVPGMYGPSADDAPPPIAA